MLELFHDMLVLFPIAVVYGTILGSRRNNSTMLCKATLLLWQSNEISEYNYEMLASETVAAVHEMSSVVSENLQK